MDETVLNRTRCCRIFATALVAIAIVGCHRDPEDSFAQSLRCGMSRAEVTRLAREHRYDTSDKSWLARSLSNRSKRSKEMTLLDLTFRDGRLVAMRQGTWDPRTKRTIVREVDLCKRGK